MQPQLKSRSSRRGLIVLAILCASAAGSLFTACAENNPTNDFVSSDSISTGSMSATADGSAFTASGKAQVTAPHASATDFGIVATNAAGARISLNMVGVSAAGTYSMAAGGAAAGTYTVGTASWLSTLSGGSGSVTFTTLTTKRAIGTFTFTGAAVVGTTAAGTKVITGGTFDITFGS